jgi:hypothetical protein
MKSVLDRLAARSVEVPCDVPGLILPCWVTIKGLDRNGYGQHRLAFKEIFGYLPDWLELDHLCRNRPCWNPWHMDPVTHKVNMDRRPGFKKDRTHCPRDHEYVGGSYYVDPKGVKICRKCLQGHGLTHRVKASGWIII